MEARYETTDWALVSGWLCADDPWRHAFAFCIRLAGAGRLDRTVFGRERIDVGAHEAALLADAALCRRAKLLFPRPRGLLVHQAARHPDGASFHSPALLSLQRHHRPVARLAQYRHFLCERRRRLYLRGTALLLGARALQIPDGSARDARGARRAVRPFHLPAAPPRDLPRSPDGHVRAINTADEVSCGSSSAVLYAT